MTVDHRATVANRKIGPIPGFVWHSWECLEDDAGTVLMTGCVSSGLYTKGPRKGRPKYDGDDKRTTVTDAEMLEERRRYERETGNCAECGGDGQAFAGWNHQTGTRWRTCPLCDGTGKPRAVNAGATPVAEGVTESAPDSSSVTAERMQR